MLLGILVVTVAQGCAGEGTGRYQLYETNWNYMYLLDTTTGDLYLVYNGDVQGPLRLSEATPLPGSASSSDAQ